MTRLEQSILDGLPTIAYWSAGCGIEVKRIEYGIEDYLTCVSNAWTGHPKYHRLKIHTTKSGRQYIAIYGYKYYLDECIRS